MGRGVTPLRELAHARAGDKGGVADLTVVAFDDEGYCRLQRQLTSELVMRHFTDLPVTRVDRYELPQLRSLKFVMHDALGRGVTSTLSLDPHGKALSSCLLSVELPDESR